MRKLKSIEQEHGDLHNLIPPLVNKLGQAPAAEKLGVAASTINLWLKENGYQKVIRYERMEQAS